MKTQFIWTIVCTLLLVTIIPATGTKQSNNSAPTNNVDWWPMFHHDLQHTGVSTSPAPYTNTVNWTFKTEGWVVSSPAVVDSKLYVGSGDGKFYCLNAENGSKIWEFQTGDMIRDSSPAVYEGKVYFGSDDGNLYCVYRANGTEKWHFHTKWFIWSSPTVCNGKVYFGSGASKIFCIDAETGFELWNHSTGNVVDSSPAVVNGRVFIGSWDGNVYCLDADTGEEVWWYQTGDWVVSSPAVVDDRVFVGSKDKKVYCFDADPSDGNDEGFDDPDGVIYDLIWTHSTGYWVYSSPAVYNGKVYIGAFEEYPATGGSFMCLNASTGTTVWLYNDTGDWVVSSPAVASGKVYFGCHDDNVYCLNATNGKMIWKYATGGWVKCSPSVADGKVYVGSSDGRVYCFYDGGIVPRIEIGKVSGVFGVHAEILNVGDVEVANVVWNISCNGGFVLFPKDGGVNGTIPSIMVGESSPVQTLVFGLGKTELTVTAEVPGVSFDSIKVRAFILGPFVILLGSYTT
jgi:outer membrane protein assembly factor BamB